MGKISVQQRKYFVGRIEQSINEKIAILKQQRAADVQKLSEAEYNRYLKTIKLDKALARYKALKDEFDLLSNSIVDVYDEIVRSIGKNKYDHDVPSIYSGSSFQDMDRGFRYLCNKTAQDQETETESGKMIRELEQKKRNACDVLHGVNELEELTAEVNNILQSADVPLLGN